MNQSMMKTGEDVMTVFDELLAKVQNWPKTEHQDVPSEKAEISQIADYLNASKRDNAELLKELREKVDRVRSANQESQQADNEMKSDIAYYKSMIEMNRNSQELLTSSNIDFGDPSQNSSQ